MLPLLGAIPPPYSKIVGISGKKGSQKELMIKPFNL